MGRVRVKGEGEGESLPLLVHLLPGRAVCSEVGKGCRAGSGRDSTAGFAGYAPLTVTVVKILAIPTLSFFSSLRVTMLDITWWPAPFRLPARMRFPWWNEPS